MHIYLDEAGNPAPLAHPSTTRHFLLVVAIVEDREPVGQAIRKLRDELGFYLELKSHKTPLDKRLALLKRARELELYFDVMVVDKQALVPRWRAQSGANLYLALIEELLLAVTQRLKNAILVVDEIDRRHTEAIRKRIRIGVNLSQLEGHRLRRIKRVVGHDSQRDDLIQLVDVVAGSVFRARERGDRRGLDAIEARIRWHRFSGEKQNGTVVRG